MAQSWIVILYTVYYYLVVSFFPFPHLFFSTSDFCQCYSQETITSTINTIKISLRLDCSFAG